MPPAPAPSIPGDRDVIPIRITAQGCEVTQDDREHADALAMRWPRFDPATMAVGFVFRIEGRSYTVEAIVSRRRRQPAVASGQGKDFRGALDELDDHIKRILRRDRTKRREFRIS